MKEFGDSREGEFCAVLSLDFFCQEHVIFSFFSRVGSLKHFFLLTGVVRKAREFFFKFSN